MAGDFSVPVQEENAAGRVFLRPAASFLRMALGKLAPKLLRRLAADKVDKQSASHQHMVVDEVLLVAPFVSQHACENDRHLRPPADRSMSWDDGPHLLYELIHPIKVLIAQINQSLSLFGLRVA
ncbi:hypothetical protein ACVINW_004179 [Bradyrhizobium sp. USDA 4461]